MTSVDNWKQHLHNLGGQRAMSTSLDPNHPRARGTNRKLRVRID